MSVPGAVRHPGAVECGSVTAPSVPSLAALLPWEEEGSSAAAPGDNDDASHWMQPARHCLHGRSLAASTGHTPKPLLVGNPGASAACQHVTLLICRWHSRWQHLHPRTTIGRFSAVEENPTQPRLVTSQELVLQECGSAAVRGQHWILQRDVTAAVL